MNELTKDRTLFNGMWIPVQEINFWQDYYSGQLETHPQVHRVLEAVTLRYLKESGKLPQRITIRDQPFNWYFPIQIKAEIFGTGLKDVDTNKFIFIRSRRIFSAS